MGKCELGGAALRPFFAAVAQNTTLRELDCRYNEISREFALSDVLPAIRGNTSLRELEVATQGGGDIVELAEAERLVSTRNSTLC